MPVKPYHYEQLLSEYSNSTSAIALLKQYRSYLEMIPSMRRPKESVIPIPLPNIRIRESISATPTPGYTVSSGEVISLPCDVAILMCDPDWKVKLGVEIFIFIHRPEEDFSDLLRRWRHTQMWLSHGYEWLMPLRYQYIIGEGSDRIYPLFVIFEDTPERIQRGLKGAALPFVVQRMSSIPQEEQPEEPSEEVLSPHED
ncbi:hypothetical protein [Phormidium sp. CCY1219]|uniref:hypothetical protein n=1 Tax=Phormidium sp. CCY1219 TaxID=2886104 RepID=UPI002D1F8F8C|nr:hypothetical protein [Phormidium sp. CCY1219]MEB3826750.1 hypothetical protein [Phormidium sp. CCY1219]